MPSNLDFNSTKVFRDFIIGKTLNVPNGPQTFTSAAYIEHDLSDMSNVDPGAVDTNRSVDLLQPQTSNIFKPTEYFIKESIDTIPRSANLALYPYFTLTNNTLVSIFRTDNYDTESELMKFAVNNIKNNKEGPVWGRISQNLDTATNGRIRLLDALNGNTATALNLVTGREPLIEFNNKITVGKTLPGKGIDFLQTVSGIEYPFSEIPGDYLSNPSNPINYRPNTTTQSGVVIQDITGVLGSLIGIQRRPKLDRKPSDLMIEYMGQGQRQRLYDNLSYSLYAPNYTTVARSQNSSKVFNFVDRASMNVNKLLGLEAPEGKSYIGDDRGTDVKFAMGDFNDRQIRSSYYLSQMFDPIQTKLFQRERNVTEGGSISGKLTWISKNSKNKLGVNNKEYSSEESRMLESKSTSFNFRDNSILGVTQDILDTMPTDGGAARSHVANVIDQTSRIFREGDIMMSRGSAIKYVDKYGGESGVEYCRVWTKDRSYMNYSDTMKRTGNIRKFDGSVMSTPWNLNIAPMSNGNKGFDGSTNIAKKNGAEFYAKKYMFSIENLAWKTSNSPGFQVQDLPYCERGNNGGRVMWFPPYDLKVNEQNTAKWEPNTFLGRPEPIYTYQNTERSGTISFKIVVDHPSILNVLVREHFKNMSDEESDNYINAFFAGCEELDFYAIIRRYSTLDSDDVTLISNYLNKKVDQKTINTFKSTSTPITGENPGKNDNVQNSVDSKPEPETTFDLKFGNNFPKVSLSETTSGDSYENLYNQYITQKGFYQTNLTTYLNELALTGHTNTQGKKERTYIYNTPNGGSISDTVSRIGEYFDTLRTQYGLYTGKTKTLKEDLTTNNIQNINLTIRSSTSSRATSLYNEKLSLRRSHSVIQDFFKKISKDGTTMPPIQWVNSNEIKNNYNSNNITISVNTGIIKDAEYKLSDFGWVGNNGKLKISSTNFGEYYSGSTITDCVNKDFIEVPQLGEYSPISFYCRQTSVKIKYDKIEQPKPNIPITPSNPSKTSLVVNGKVTNNLVPKKPQIDVMKRIVMKTLSECYYFKKLEEDSPIAFNSLKEKLKYFHPGFHSTTPEGLNSRLTFLQQCIRPGETIPIKGLSDNTDFGARNTTFGPPPICVLRIGDFYHSKIVIKDVNITFDDSPWDLNPEGIGVQPMIANVTLQINFIGGHGLEKPVERLQNALSSNFYANTEMYDERSISTNQTIGGEDVKKYTTEFLEKLQNDNIKQKEPNNTNKGNEFIEGKYIGVEYSDELNYTTLIDDFVTKAENYILSYPQFFNTIFKSYGDIVSSMVLLPSYRTIKTYDVYTTTESTPSNYVTILGLFEKTKELSVLVETLKTEMIRSINAYNLSDIIGFSSDIPSTDKLNSIITPIILTSISDKLDKITQLNGFDNVRNNLITSLDKLNFIVKYGKDVKYLGVNSIETLLSGFTSDDLYSEYIDSINSIKENSANFYGELNDINGTFYNPSIDSTTLGKILSVLLFDYKNTIKNAIEGSYSGSNKDKLNKTLDTFIVSPTEIIFKFKKFKKRKTNTEFKFKKGSTINIVDNNLLNEMEKLFSTKYLVTDKLNYYKK